MNTGVRHSVMASRSISHPPRWRRAGLGALAALSLIASACGASDEPIVEIGSSAQPEADAAATIAVDAVADPSGVDAVADPSGVDVDDLGFGSGEAIGANRLQLLEAAGADSEQFGATLDDFVGTKVDRPEATPPPPGFEEIEWDDLIAPGFTDQDISDRFDERMAEVEPGSPEADKVFEELQAEYDNQPINPEIAGNDIQLAGFVAPITYIDDIITEFLLVPYFGACIHVPPPPVNQTVMVSLQPGDGLTVEESWGPVWVTGTLTLDGTETEIGTAGYSISSAQSGVYDSF